MNREIKFRGQPVRKGGIWMVGIGAYKTHTAEHLVLNARCDCVEVVHLCQYTGLKDCNGKEIYEGDIVRTHRGTIDVVTYDSIAFNMCVAYAAYPKGKCATFFNSNPLEGIEVVGNIFDNPELMKGGTV